ncbi:NEL-type E3 ubiquitin ligase domain-containing protein [Pseudomonas sp. NPDC086278]|uniref:NEL-type E3 ubiquitin ligase domain-containing protein n=1 Tax=Pseudomonas sp. NPDC086278 TaxID=3390646 RepID=UPI003CFF1896
MTDFKADFPDWYIQAQPMDRQYLQELIQERWHLQEVVAGRINNLQTDIKAFAKPLLAQAIKDELNVELDVDTTALRLYERATLGFGIDTQASRVRQSSLLEAALHNFEASEALEGAFRDESGIFVKDAEGELRRHQLTVGQFVALCRKLDIGAQYQQHIKPLLEPSDVTERDTFEQQFIAQERAAFNESMTIALLKNDIDAYTCGTLRKVWDNQKNILYRNRPLQAHRLSLLGTRLTGIVLFSAVADPSKIKTAIDQLVPEQLQTLLDWSRRLSVLPGQEFDQFKVLQAFFANGPTGVVEEMLRRNDVHEHSRLDGTLIAYIPDDPDHPLKQYDSFTDFMTALTAQLRGAEYQAFFSRFVPHKDKGRFFARVNERFSTFTWHQREPLNMGPWWRETAVENPDAEPITRVIDGDFWQQFCRWRKDKALADARQIAVPTGDEDAAARWKRLSSYLDIGWNLFNFGAMLVPGLGEAVLAAMVGQMMLETLEGIEDWSTGDKEEASAHLTGVLINFAQLTIMGAGHVLPGGAPAPVKASPFIDGLKTVELADGTTRLWNPDLSPYEHNVSLPKDSRPDERGLHRHNDQDILPMDGKYFEVKAHPHTGQPRLRHPSRPTAYQPRLEHNGAGAWQTELDRPREWDKTVLMRRLGPSVDGFSDVTLEHIRIASGVDEHVLRKLQVETESPPALLADTLTRFQAYADVATLVEQIRANQVAPEWVDHLPPLMTELPYWPEYKGIELFRGPELWGDSILHGNPHAAPAHRVKLTFAELIAGKLFDRVVDAFDENELQRLLGRTSRSDRPASIDALRERLALRAQQQNNRLFQAFYKRATLTSDANVALLQDAFAQLPTDVAKELLAGASPQELAVMVERKRVPLQLKERARAALLEVRLNRSYEGLFLDALENADTERLVLHSLESLAGWSDNLRLEIRNGAMTGVLEDSIGPVDAAVRKVLIRNENGLYEARNDNDHELHGPDSLFAAVLHALPDAEREALGYRINQSEALKQAVLRSPLSHETFRAILAEHPLRRLKFDPETMKLRGGMRGFRRATGQLTEQERLQSLRPGWSETDIETYLAHSDSGATAQERVSALEAEFNQLNKSFRRWLDSPTDAYRLSPDGMSQWQSRNSVYKSVRQCWQRSGPRDVDAQGNPTGWVLDLSDIPLGQHLETMPKLEANFDHVTRLKLFNTGMTDAHVSFLEPFPRLRSLNMNANQLTRLPAAVGRMRHLTDLRLGNNRIELTGQTRDALRDLFNLEIIDLQRNPLRRVPDISRMPRLHTLILADTGISTWPDGLFSLARMRHFHLSLQANVITLVPQVVPGSVEAELLARTLLNREPRWISQANLDQLRAYIRSVGLDPERPYPSRGVRDSLDWETGLTREQWVDRQPVWNEVEDEFGSVPFFDHIRLLTRSTSFEKDRAFRLDMTAKLWRMLEAMHKDSELRRNIFTLAREPINCVDAGASLFNAMGLEVLIHEAYELANPGLVEAELVSLAKGKSRLDELSRIAHKEIAGRLAKGERFRQVNAQGDVTGTIDEVETHLAYMTDLASRLDLPWQSRDLQFRTHSGVTPQMIDDACTRVLALEEGDLLRDSIVEQPFWATYLQGSNRAAFKAIRRRLDATTEFYMALEKRATESLSAQEKAQLKEEIRVLAAELGKPESEFAPGCVMTADDYETEMNLLNAQKLGLLKTLTQQAMDRAKLQRGDIPFTVKP